MALPEQEGIPLEVNSVVADPEVLFRPCVDCGWRTGCFCDYCKAAQRLSNEEWAVGQNTPLCTDCDRLEGVCHYCRGVHMPTPFPRGPPLVIPGES